MSEDVERRIADGFRLLGLETSDSRDAFVRLAALADLSQSVPKENFEWTDTLRTTFSGVSDA
jgi:hypothetical protein